MWKRQKKNGKYKILNCIRTCQCLMRIENLKGGGGGGRRRENNATHRIPQQQQQRAHIHSLFNFNEQVIKEVTSRLYRSAIKIMSIYSSRYSRAPRIFRKKPKVKRNCKGVVLCPHIRANQMNGAALIIYHRPAADLGHLLSFYIFFFYITMFYLCI